VCAGQRLTHSVDGVARYGTNRRAALLGLLLASALCTALASTLITIAGLLGAHAPRSTALVADVRTSVGIALLAGAVYALYFGAASLLGKRGGGRKWALIIDFVLGAGSSALAAPWPRGHVRNLLGGAPVVELTQLSAWVALAVIGGEPQDVKFKRENSYLEIGDDNLIREFCTFHRANGEGETTRIGSRNFFMVGVHVAHNCVIGDDNIFAN
jgi:hypothetical protein